MCLAILQKPIVIIAQSIIQKNIGNIIKLELCLVSNISELVFINLFLLQTAMLMFIAEYKQEKHFTFLFYSTLSA